MSGAIDVVYDKLQVTGLWWLTPVCVQLYTTSCFCGVFWQHKRVGLRRGRGGRAPQRLGRSCVGLEHPPLPNTHTSGFSVPSIHVAHKAPYPTVNSPKESLLPWDPQGFFFLWVCLLWYFRQGKGGAMPWSGVSSSSFPHLWWKNFNLVSEATKVLPSTLQAESPWVMGQHQLTHLLQRTGNSL